MSHSAVVDAWREREEALRTRGHEVRLLSALAWNEGGTTIALEPRPGEPVQGLHTLGRHPALFVYDPRPIWRAMGDRWDVIDIHEEPFALSTAETLLLRALRRQKAPYVLYSAQNLDKRYPVPFRWLERWALRHAAGVSVCNVAAGHIVERKGLACAATVIPLGTDASFSSPEATHERAPEPHRIHVGYVGRLEAHKGVDVLLDAVAGDPRLFLRMAGGGSLMQPLRARVQADGFDDRVDFAGPLEQSDLPQFYRSLDVLAVPSLTTPSWVEQFGRVAVEAMACGTPVVASDSGALPEVVGGAGIMVAPGDASALRRALLRVGTEPETAAAMREAGLAKATKTSWTAVAGLQEALYIRALGPRTADTALPGADQPSPPVEVVVVAYGAPELLRRALEPLRGEAVTVVDNSSSDAVREVCASLGVRYVDPGHNGGFAAGVNIGLLERRSASSDVLLLNPDAMIEPSGIRQLQQALRASPDLASVSPRIRDAASGEERVMWPFPSPGGAWLDALGLGRWRPVSFAIGAVLLLRAEAVAELGGFDESFFLYAEETDWAYRAARRGWRHGMVPEVTATHVGAGTSSDPGRREAHFHASQERYYRKHFGSPGWQVARAAQIAGATVRGLRGGAAGRAALSRVATYVRGPLRVEASYRGTVVR
ncbi:MAG TPA: glycosyltransferase [Intrasporangium sp.]|uniref:glycosyltransferase n=1 Tax=Intrasporangium sp. TaxID=1925024 RepID=UPI002B49B6AA|nr:glycosyltransferase [Intrasporangium sp.]HKX68283.1 glycosyltransferase [Intrasporangium sp.]